MDYKFIILAIGASIIIYHLWWEASSLRKLNDTITESANQLLMTHRKLVAQGSIASGDQSSLSQPRIIPTAAITDADVDDPRHRVQPSKKLIRLAPFDDDTHAATDVMNAGAELDMRLKNITDMLQKFTDDSDGQQCIDNDDTVDAALPTSTHPVTYVHTPVTATRRRGQQQRRHRSSTACTDDTNEPSFEVLPQSHSQRSSIGTITIDRAPVHPSAHAVPSSDDSATIQSYVRGGGASTTTTNTAISRRGPITQPQDDVTIISWRGADPRAPEHRSITASGPVTNGHDDAGLRTPSLTAHRTIFNMIDTADIAVHDQSSYDSYAMEESILGMTSLASKQSVVPPDTDMLRARRTTSTSHVESLDTDSRMSINSGRFNMRVHTPPLTPASMTGRNIDSALTTLSTMLNKSIEIEVLSPSIASTDNQSRTSTMSTVRRTITQRA